MSFFLGFSSVFKGFFQCLLGFSFFFVICVCISEVVLGFCEVVPVFYRVSIFFQFFVGCSNVFEAFSVHFLAFFVAFAKVKQLHGFETYSQTVSFWF